MYIYLYAIMYMHIYVTDEVHYKPSLCTCHPFASNPESRDAGSSSPNPKPSTINPTPWTLGPKP